MPYLAVIYGVIIVLVLVDIVFSDGHHVRGVPKMVWVLLSMALPLVGPIAWLALGRPPKDDAPADATSRDKPRVHPSAPGSHADPEAQAALFAAQVRERAEQQRRVAPEQRDAEG